MRMLQGMTGEKRWGDRVLEGINEEKWRQVVGVKKRGFELGERKGIVNGGRWVNKTQGYQFQDVIGHKGIGGNRAGGSVGWDVLEDSLHRGFWSSKIQYVVQV